MRARCSHGSQRAWRPTAARSKRRQSAEKRASRGQLPRGHSTGTSRTSFACAPAASKSAIRCSGTAQMTSIPAAARNSGKRQRHSRSAPPAAAGTIRDEHSLREQAPVEVFVAIEHGFLLESLLRRMARVRRDGGRERWKQTHARQFARQRFPVKASAMKPLWPWFNCSRTASSGVLTTQHSRNSSPPKPRRETSPRLS